MDEFALLVNQHASEINQIFGKMRSNTDFDNHMEKLRAALQA